MIKILIYIHKEWNLEVKIAKPKLISFKPSVYCSKLKLITDFYQLTHFSLSNEFVCVLNKKKQHTNWENTMSPDKVNCVSATSRSYKRETTLPKHTVALTQRLTTCRCVDTQHTVALTQFCTSSHSYTTYHNAPFFYTQHMSSH